MNPKISWRSFSARRNANLAQIIDDNGFTTLSEVEEYLANYWVAAPTQEEYDEALTRTKKYSNVPESSAEVVPDVVQKPAVKSTSRRATKKTTSTRSTTKKASENPDELWEDAQEGAYQTKSTAAKKKASTRKTSTRKTSTKKKSS